MIGNQLRCYLLPLPDEELLAQIKAVMLQNQVRELHRLLGKKTLEVEIVKEALEHAMGSKKQLRLPPSPLRDGSR